MDTGLAVISIIRLFDFNISASCYFYFLRILM